LLFAVERFGHARDSNSFKSERLGVLAHRTPGNVATTRRPAGDPREISDRPELFEKIVSSAERQAWRAAAEELAARVRGGMT
jgi:hypothetical protein